ncbi:hypothetical protein CANARDRAFT_228750 [[Candida] arabinofermentans NRRL YB-2248]|uniref:Nucleolar pre-ribosomal-associated protein 1 n=1 Tax=[Candida] arabinofermentans NRRL YB-2248 TaxID=983967 RepID=A0A1E4T8P1_9ASCO|nr:hypothetical protein CANARDRAFT_228750 [[Candida] arabinofermentans NRRL YB-2248]
MIPTKQELSDPSKCRTNASIRHNFVLFWMNLCSYANPLTRKDLLTNSKKIMTNWLKYIGTYDSPDLVEKTLKFMDQKILMEETYKKMTKAKIFGDWIAKKLVELYLIAEIRPSVHEFLKKLTTDYKDGVVFHDDKVWFSSSIGSSSSGVVVTVGERSFRIYNKLIYTMLTGLKPWSDDMQLELVVAILDASPELIPVYNFYSFHSTGQHDPALSSYFIGQSLLLTKLIQLHIPENFTTIIKSQIRRNEEDSATRSTGNLSALNLIEVICPSQLNRSSFTKGLSIDSPLIKHINTELIISVFQKLNRILNLLSFNESTLYNALKNELLEIVSIQKLPDLSVIIGAMNDCHKNTPENKLLIFNYLKICEFYKTTLTKSGTVSLPAINLGQQQSQFKGIDLVILDSYLQLNSDSPYGKWWTISSGYKNTMFTTILRVPYQLRINGADSESISHKVVDVVTNLVDSTLVFQNHLTSNTILKSQVFALLQSLNQFSQYVNDEAEVNKVAGIIDEAIGRCIKSPYKYIDISNEIDGSNPVSPFFIAVVEQSKFIKGSTENVLLFIGLLARYMALIGEPLDSMKSIVAKYWEVSDLIDFSENTYEESLTKFYEKFYAHNGNKSLLGNSFFEIIMNFPVSKLAKAFENKIPMSETDAIAILKRASLIIGNAGLQLSSVENLLTELISKTGNYLIQRLSSFSDSEAPENSLNLLASKYWNGLYFNVHDITTKDDKKAFSAGLLNEVFSKLYELEDNEGHMEHFSDYALVVRDLLDSIESKLPIDNQNVLADSLWILEDDLVVNYLVSLDSDMAPVIRSKLFDISVYKGLKVSVSDFLILVKTTSESNFQNLSIIAKNVSFTRDKFEETLTFAKDNDLIYPILTSIIKTNPTFVDLAESYATPLCSTLVNSAEGFDFLRCLTDYNLDLSSQILKVVYETSIQGINRVIQTCSVGSSPLNLYLKAASKQPTNEENVTIVEKLLAIDEFRNNATLVFSNEFVDFILLSIDAENTSVLKPWLYRGTLYITKMLAETPEGTQLPKIFLNFLSSMKEIFSKFPGWKLIPKNMLNTQLEVGLSKKWVQVDEILQYFHCILVSGSKNVIEFDKHTQIFVNNESSSLNETPSIDNATNRFYSSLILFALFKFDIKKIATPALQIKLLKLYSGSLRSEDLIIKNLLYDLEICLNRSWVHYLFDWEFVEEESSSDLKSATRLFTNAPTSSFGLTVNLAKRSINKTINNIGRSSEVSALPKLKSGINCWEYNTSQWRKFYEHNLIVLNDEVDDDLCYDPGFLLLLIINNEELFKYGDNEVDVDVKKLINSDLLQFVVASLASQDVEVKNTSKRILYSSLLSIEAQIKEFNAAKESKDTEKLQISSFKDRSLFKVYIGNLLNTLEQAEQDSEVIAPVVISMLSHLIPILNNPGHFLYEKTYRYILAGPKFRVFEIPLTRTITQDFITDPHLTPSTGSNDPSEEHYKRLSWLLDTLFNCITSPVDLKVVSKSGILDYILSLSSSPMLSFKVQIEILKILMKISEIPNGADLLIRSYGLLSFIESKKFRLIDLKGNKMNRESLMNDYQLLSLQKLILKSDVAVECNGADKRAREWCDEDIDRSIKRVLIG